MVSGIPGVRGKIAQSHVETVLRNGTELAQIHHLLCSAISAWETLWNTVYAKELYVETKQHKVDFIKSSLFHYFVCFFILYNIVLKVI